MDLTGLARADVAEVIGRLALAQAAADVLADGGLEPVIDLTDDGLMLSAAWCGEVGAAEAAEPDWPVVIEDAGSSAPSGAPQVGQDTGEAEAQPQPEPAGEQGAEATPPAEDAARGAFPGGGQDLPASQPGMTGLSARGEGSTAQSPEPAPAAGESGLAAAEDPDLPGSSPSAEPPAAVTGTAAAVEAPPLPGQNPPAGEGKGDPVKPAPWTAEEDALLLDIVATGVLAGKSRQAAIYDAADALGRPREGSRNRVYVKLGQRLDSEIAARARAAKDGAAEPAVAKAPAPAAPVAATPPLSAEPIAEAAPAKPRAKAARPVAPADLSGAHRRIWDWLDGIEDTADFSAADDLYMVDCFAHGTKVSTLALDMGVDAKALLDRFKLVTQCIRDGKDRIQPDLHGKLGEVLRLRVKILAELKAA